MRAGGGGGGGGGTLPRFTDPAEGGTLGKGLGETPPAERPRLPILPVTALLPTLSLFVWLLV